MIPLLVRASCATPPPSGQECHDTVELIGTTPLWLPFAILALCAVVAVIVLMAVRPRHR